MNMIHVNVKRMDRGSSYLLEVSVDGAPFVEHWQLASRGATELDADLAAAADGRIYAAGIKFGGSDVRLTAFGREIYVPDLATTGASNDRT